MLRDLTATTAELRSKGGLQYLSGGIDALMVRE